jgi:hypothetical protein
MKKFRNILLVMFVPILISIGIGCCCGSFTNEYKVCSFSLESLDYSRSWPGVSTTKKVPKDSFGVRINIDLNNRFCLNDLQPLFISTASACQPYIENIPLDTIISIKIKTLKDFDLAHKANDVISDYFSVWYSRELIKIDEFIKFRYLKSYGSDDLFLTIDLRLATPPKENLEAQFEVQILLSNGKVLTKTSELVILK